MKKVLSMVLAMATVASMASVAFAVAADQVEFTGGTPTDTTEMMYKQSDVYVMNDDGLLALNTGTGEIAKGDSFYLPLDIGSSLEHKDVKKWKVKAEWLLGEDLLEAKPEIAYKKTAGGNYEYFVQVQTKQAFSTSKDNVVGFISVYKGSSNVARTPKRAVIEWGQIGETTVYIGADNATYDFSSMTIKNNEAPYVFKFKNGGSDHADYVTTKDETDVITFEGVGEFEGNFFEQGKLFLGFNTEFIPELGEAYPDAEMDFVTFPGSPMFNKWGTMRLTNPNSDEDDKFIYALVDGKLEAVEAKWDSDFEGYVFGARTLGSYIISDKELDVSVFNNAVDTNEPTDDTDAPSEDGTSDVPTEVVKDNPETGR